VTLWTHEEIRVICLRPPGLEDHPDLAVRIRGALGRKLMPLGGPVQHRHDPFDRPAPYPYLYGSGAVARPFTIDCDVVGQQVIVDLRLFGDARIWADQVRDALLSALEDGIAVRAESRIRYAITPIDCMMRRKAADLPPAEVRSVHLTFLTPVAVRDGSRLTASPAAYLWAAVTRTRDLAPWLGARVVARWDDLRAAVDDIAVVSNDVIPVRFRRWSQRQRDKNIPMMGFMGSVRLSGRLTEFAPFLSIANETHIGSHAALGFGRISAALYPT
jgi:hypothetical protein